MQANLNFIKHENFIRNAIPLDQQYDYQIFTADYLDDVVRVFTETFCTSEPMTHYLQMDKEKYTKFARAVALQAIKDQLSVIALHKGKVVAFALVEDIAKPGELPDFDPKFNFILGLLDKLGKHYFNNKQFAPRHIAHLFITAVAEKYRNQKLSTQVNFHAMDLAAHQGFDFMYCEFTNYINEKGTIPHLQNPKKLIGAEEYKKFTLDRQKPFERLEYGANSYLWEVHENAILQYRTDDGIIRQKL